MKSSYYPNIEHSLPQKRESEKKKIVENKGIC